MPRLRRYLPPLLIFLPLIFVCGKLLLTPVEFVAGTRSHFADVEVDGIQLSCFLNTETGWPWIFQRRGDVMDSSSPYNGQSMVQFFSLGMVLTDLGVLFAALATLSLVGLWLFRRFLRRLQYSLRTLLCVTALVAVVLALLIRELDEYRRQKKWIERLTPNSISAAREDLSPEWARRLLPDKLLEVFYFPVVMLQQTYSTTPAAIESAVTAIADLPHVRSIDFEFVSNEALRIHDPESLNRINSVACIADDDTLKALGKLPNLRRLRLTGPMTDAGLGHLWNCTSLEVIELLKADITDAGVLPLRTLPKLKELVLFDPAAVSEDTIPLLEEQIALVRLVRFNTTERRPTKD
jgi:hypothetical protein